MAKQRIFNFQHELELIKEQFDFDLVALALIQSVKINCEIRWIFSIGNKTERFRKTVLQSGKGIAGQVFKSGKSMLFEDVEVAIEQADLFNYPIVVAEELKSFGAIPLYKYNRVEGVLLVGYRESGKLTSEKFVEFKKFVGAEFGPFYDKEMVQE
jgi:nitrogen regulatory protein A